MQDDFCGVGQNFGKLLNLMFSTQIWSAHMVEFGMVFGELITITVLMIDKLILWSKWAAFGSGCTQWVPSSRAVLLSIFKVSPTKTVRRPTPHKNRYIKLVCRSGEPQFFCVATAAKKASTHKYISSRFLLLRASRAALCHTKSINTYARQGLAKRAIN